MIPGEGGRNGGSLGKRNWHRSRKDSPARDTTPSVVSAPTRKSERTLLSSSALFSASRSISCCCSRRSPRVRCVKDSKWNWRRASEYSRFFDEMGFFVREARAMYVCARRLLSKVHAPIFKSPDRWSNGCLIDVSHLPSREICKVSSANERYVRFSSLRLLKLWCYGWCDSGWLPGTLFSSALCNMNGDGIRASSLLQGAIQIGH